MKKTILIILIFLLLLPKLQEYLKILKVKQLYGFSISTSKPEFSWPSWMSGDYQNNYSAHYAETFGLRDWFVFLNNQIDYSLFSKTHADVIVGKKGYFFQGGYIDEVTGKAFIGDDNMENNIKNIKRIQNYLDSRNIFLMTVLAPGKTDYYKEYLPDYYASRITERRNYNSILKYSKEKNIRLIDFNKWVMEIKDTSKYPLFPKQGIHWNFYCMALCADSMVKYIEKNSRWDIGNFSWTLEHPDNLRGTDYDLGQLLNIFQKLPYDKMAYPNYKFENDTTKLKPRLMVVADSFYWTIFNEKLFSNIFSDETFIYYYSSIYPYRKMKSEFILDMNILNEIEKYDVVILLQSSGNYGNPGVNFVPHFGYALDRLEQFTARELKANLESGKFENEINRLADSLKISKDSAQMFFADIRVRNNLNKVAEIKIQMRGNPGWMNELNIKSEQQDKSLDQVMQEDAEWMVNAENEKNK